MNWLLDADGKVDHRHNETEYAVVDAALEVIMNDPELIALVAFKVARSPFRNFIEPVHGKHLIERVKQNIWRHRSLYGTRNPDYYPNHRKHED